MTKNGQNPKNYVKNRSQTHNMSSNLSKNPFSMFFVDIDTYLIDISNLKVSHTTLRSCVVRTRKKSGQGTPPRPHFFKLKLHNICRSDYAQTLFLHSKGVKV